MIEVMIATVLFSMIILTFITSIASLGFTQIRSRTKTQAIQLAREGIEIAYNLSVYNWTDFSSLDGQYYPEINPGGAAPFAGHQYTFVSGSENLSTRFTRTVEVETVMRDSNGNVSTSGTVDGLTKKITSRVSWLENGTTQEVTITTFTTSLESIL